MALNKQVNKQHTSLAALPYVERLKFLKLPSLLPKSKRGDMIFACQLAITKLLFHALVRILESPESKKLVQKDRDTLIEQSL